MPWWSEPTPASAARLMPGSAVNGSARPAKLLVDARRHRPGGLVATEPEGPDPLEVLAAEVESIRSEAYAAGRRQAEEELAAQYHAMLKKYAADTARLVSALTEAVAAVESGRAEAVEVLAGDAAELAFALVETMVGREIELASAPGVDAVKRALALVPDDEPLVFHLHPEDLDAVRERAGDAGLDSRGLSFVADPEVGRGGCVVDAGPCRIDASIDSALERVRAAIGASGGSSTRPRGSTRRGAQATSQRGAKAPSQSPRQGSTSAPSQSRRQGSTSAPSSSGRPTSQSPPSRPSSRQSEQAPPVIDAEVAS